MKVLIVFFIVLFNYFGDFNMEGFDFVVIDCKEEGGCFICEVW